MFWLGDEPVSAHNGAVGRPVPGSWRTESGPGDETGTGPGRQRLMTCRAVPSVGPQDTALRHQGRPLAVVTPGGSDWR